MGRPLGILLAVALAFGLVACSDDPAVPTGASGGSGSTADATTFPVTVSFQVAASTRGFTSVVSTV